jgi:hypothetical protein
MQALNIYLGSLQNALLPALALLAEDYNKIIRFNSFLVYTAVALLVQHRET